FCVADFVKYIFHHLFHKVPFFWEFHKVHHSAETLTPFTNYRIHPVEHVAAYILFVFMGSFNGIIHYLFGPNLQFLSIFGVDLIFFLVLLLLPNLNHSHIWLQYPPWLSRILVSPAQHQIHHSKDPKHYDKNFGGILSCWDYLFGTLYSPKLKEN